MKKIIAFILLGVLGVNCSNRDDGDIDCALFDPAFPALYVRIIDNEGVNVFEKGTIDSESIRVEGDFSSAGFQFIPAKENVNPDAEIRKLDNTINLSIPNQSTFRYTIHLDGFEAINLDFTAELTEIPCGIAYFKPAEVNHIAEEVEMGSISPLQYLVVVQL